MSLFACLRCFVSFPAWVYCWLGRCPHCYGALEEIAPEPERVLAGEY